MTLSRRLVLSTLGLALAGLAGCATFNTLRVEVRSFGSWPADRKAGSFAFDRLPSQQAQAELQSRLEAAALPALQAAGFTAVPKEQAQVLVQLSVQATQTRPDYIPGPHLRYDAFWGRGSRGGFYGPSFGFEFQPAVVEQRVAVLMRDRKLGDVLYEASGVIASSWASESHWTPMFAAVLKDFPGPAISPRVVAMPLGGEATVAPEPAASAAAR